MWGAPLDHELQEWKRVVPGNIIKVESENFIPADLLILKTSDAKGGCYVETKNLDGETNLKTKMAEKELQNMFNSHQDLSNIDG